MKNKQYKNEEWTDRELLALSLEEANSYLNDKQFERWKELKESKLRSEAKENVKEWSKQDNESIDTLIKASERELTTTVDVFGLELEATVTLDREQVQQFIKLDNLSKKLSDVDKGELEEFENLAIVLLSDIVLDFSKPEWKKFAEAKGLRGLMNVLVQIFTQVMQEDNKIKENIKSFRGS